MPTDAVLVHLNEQIHTYLHMYSITYIEDEIVKHLWKNNYRNE
jgi:hypothetical protein